MSGKRGPSPGTYRPDWSWKPTARDRRQMATGRRKHNSHMKAASDYLKSMEEGERTALLRELGMIT